MGRLRRAYLDNCSFDRLVSDNEALSLCLRLHREGRFACLVSPVNIDEISCVAKSKGRGRAHELLDILASIAWPRFLKEPPHYLDEIGYYVLRTNLRRPSIFYESGSHHSVL